MNKKSAEQNIVSFLKENPSRFAAAQLQRMSFKNSNGTLASPKAISRRLQENAEEGGVLEVSYDDHNNAFYQIKEGQEKKVQVVEQLSNGHVKVSYVYVGEKREKKEKRETDRLPESGEGASQLNSVSAGDDRKVSTRVYQGATVDTTEGRPSLSENLTNGSVRVNYVPVTPSEDGVAVKKIETRTDRQNRAMHLWFTMLGETLNTAGLDQRKVLKPSVSIPWTPTAIKEQLWRPIQEAMFEKKSTTELSKTEVGKVEEVLTRHLGQKFGIECPIWPHYEEGEYEETTSSL